MTWCRDSSDTCVASETPAMASPSASNIHRKSMWCAPSKSSSEPSSSVSLTQPAPSSGSQSCARGSSHPFVAALLTATPSVGNCRQANAFWHRAGGSASVFSFLRLGLWRRPEGAQKHATKTTSMSAAQTRVKRRSSSRPTRQETPQLFRPAVTSSSMSPTVAELSRGSVSSSHVECLGFKKNPEMWNRRAFRGRPPSVLLNTSFNRLCAVTAKLEVDLPSTNDGLLSLEKPLSAIWSIVPATVDRWFSMAPCIYAHADTRAIAFRSRLRKKTP